jgi:hypothetical protein
MKLLWHLTASWHHSAAQQDITVDAMQQVFNRTSSSSNSSCREHPPSLLHAPRRRAHCQTFCCRCYALIRQSAPLLQRRCGTHGWLRPALMSRGRMQLVVATAAAVEMISLAAAGAAQSEASGAAVGVCASAAVAAAKASAAGVEPPSPLCCCCDVPVLIVVVVVVMWA